MDMYIYKQVVRVHAFVVCVKLALNWLCVRACVRACQEEDKEVIRNKIVEVFTKGDMEEELALRLFEARRRFDKEVML